MKGRSGGTLNIIYVINVTHLPVPRHQGKEEKKDLFYYSWSSSVVQFANRLKLDSVSLLRVLGCSFGFSWSYTLAITLPILGFLTSLGPKNLICTESSSRDSGFIGQDPKVKLKGLPIQFPPQHLRALPVASLILIKPSGKEERKDLLCYSCLEVFAHQRMSRL